MQTCRMKKRPAGTAHVSNSVFALPGCCCFLGCCCFPKRMPPSTSFFWMIWRITNFFRPNGVWLGFHHGILNLIPNFGQPHVSVVKVISVLAPPSLLKSSAINFDVFSYWGCGEKEALQQSDRGIFAFLQFSLSVHVKWTSIRLESWHCPKAFCILQSNICYFFAGWWPTTWSTAAAAQGIFVFFLVVFKH